MRKSLTPIEKRLAAYATAAGVALAVAPAAGAQVIYTDVEPDVCLSGFSTHFIDLDNDGVDDFRIAHGYSFAPFGGACHTFTCYGDIEGNYGDNRFMAFETGRFAQDLSSGATISSLQNFENPSNTYYALFSFGVGPWHGGNNAFVGLKFVADRAGAATTHYGWVRISSSDDVLSICIHDFAYESTPDAPIGGGAVPVELVSFYAQVSGDNVALNWETSSETNNAGFEVQMWEGEDWQALGFVEGHGTTTEAQTYSYAAIGMDVGTHTFRLRQIDFDGAFEYSPEVEATIEVVGTHQLSNAYPNPFNPTSQFTVAVSTTQQVKAELFNTLGQRVAILFDGRVEANQTQYVTIDGAGLASGMYVVRVSGKRFRDNLNVTLMK